MYQGRHDEHTEVAMEMVGWELQAWINTSEVVMSLIRYDLILGESRHGRIRNKMPCLGVGGRFSTGNHPGTLCVNRWADDTP